MFKSLIGTAVVAAIVLTGASAQAGFVGFLTGMSTDTYNYTLRFTPDVTAPAFGQEKLVAWNSVNSGSLVTFYDVVPLQADLVSANVNGLDAADFIVDYSGLTPPNLVGAAGIPVNPGVDITFKYIGTTLTTTKDFSVTILTTGGFSSTIVGTGVGETLVDFGQGYTAEKDSLYPVLLPAIGGGGGPDVPEPASLGVLAVGSLALMARRRRA